MNKGNFLFDMAKLVQRPIPEQRTFELEYYNFLLNVPELTNKAFSLTNAEKKGKMPLSINRIWFANTMNGNLLSLMAEAYPNYVKSTGRGSYCMLLNSKYECYIKKLNKNLFPSYNHSKASRALCAQRAMPNQEPIPVVYIGYTTNKTNDDIKGYFAVCIKGKERLWRTDLTAIEPPETLGVEIDNNPIKPVAPEVTVKIKPNKKAK